MKLQYRNPLYDWIIAVVASVAFVLALSVALSGCATTERDGIERPVLSPAEIEIILEEAQIAVNEYLKVVVPEPTPAQQLAISAGRILVRIAVLKLREAGMYEDATRLEVQAGFVELEPPLEPLVAPDK